MPLQDALDQMASSQPVQNSQPQGGGLQAAPDAQSSQPQTQQPQPGNSSIKPSWSSMGSPNNEDYSTAQGAFNAVGNNMTRAIASGVGGATKAAGNLVGGALSLAGNIPGLGGLQTAGQAVQGAGDTAGNALQDFAGADQGTRAVADLGGQVLGAAAGGELLGVGKLGQVAEAALPAAKIPFISGLATKFPVLAKMFGGAVTGTAEGNLFSEAQSGNLSPTDQNSVWASLGSIAPALSALSRVSKGGKGDIFQAADELNKAKNGAMEEVQNLFKEPTQQELTINKAFGRAPGVVDNSEKIMDGVSVVAKDIKGPVNYVNVGNAGLRALPKIGDELESGLGAIDATGKKFNEPVFTNALDSLRSEFGKVKTDKSGNELFTPTTVSPEYTQIANKVNSLYEKSLSDGLTAKEANQVKILYSNAENLFPGLKNTTAKFSNADALSARAAMKTAIEKAGSAAGVDIAEINARYGGVKTLIDSISAAMEKKGQYLSTHAMPGSVQELAKTIGLAIRPIRTAMGFVEQGTTMINPVTAEKYLKQAIRDARNGVIPQVAHGSFPIASADDASALKSKFEAKTNIDNAKAQFSKMASDAAAAKAKARDEVFNGPLFQKYPAGKAVQDARAQFRDSMGPLGEPSDPKAQVLEGLNKSASENNRNYNTNQSQDSSDIVNGWGSVPADVVQEYKGLSDRAKQYLLPYNPEKGVPLLPEKATEMQRSVQGVQSRGKKIELPEGAKVAKEVETPVLAQASGQETNLQSAKESGGVAEKMYHGTNEKFDNFDFSKVGSNEGSLNGKGVYLTSSKEVAGGYGKIIKESQVDASSFLNLNEKPKSWQIENLKKELGDDFMDWESVKNGNDIFDKIKWGLKKDPEPIFQKAGINGLEYYPSVKQGRTRYKNVTVFNDAPLKSNSQKELPLKEGGKKPKKK